MNHWLKQQLITPTQRHAYLEQVERRWRDRLAPPLDLDPCDWCEANIILTRSSAAQGFIRFSKTPYLREIVRTVTQSLDRVTLCWSSQIGKSQALTCICAFVIATRPVPILLALSTKEMAEEFSQEKLDPVIRNCDALNKLLLSGREDDTTLRKRFQNCTLIIQGGQSKRAAKSRSVGLLQIDETETMPPAVYANFLQRTKAFPGAKIYEASTPDMEEGPIWVAFNQGTCERFHLRMPCCQEFLPLEWEHLKFGEARDGDTWNLDKVLDCTYYRCPSCGERVDEIKKPEMLESGIWVAEHPERKRHRSFALNALYSPFQSWGEVARDFLNAQGSPEACKEWRTGSLAIPWSIGARQNIVSRLAQKCSNYDRGQVPVPVSSLVLASDFGAKELHWVVAGVSAADEKGKGGGATFIIDVGTDASLEQLAERKERMNYGGLPITFVAVDCGYETIEVKDFCRRHNWVPIIGNTKIGQRTHYNKEDGHLLVQVDLFKDILQDKIDSEDGKWNLFRDDQSLDEFFSQMSAEQRILVPAGFGTQRRKWQKLRKANHWFDAAVYVEAIAYHFGLRFGKPMMPILLPEAKQQAKREEPRMDSAFDRLEKYSHWHR